MELYKVIFYKNPRHGKKLKSAQRHLVNKYGELKSNALITSIK